MPLFVIEREFAEQLHVNADGFREVEAANREEGVRWVYSFLTADGHKTYCLYEAPTADHIHAAARRSGLPADVVVEVQQFSAGGFTTVTSG